MRLNFHERSEIHVDCCLAVRSHSRRVDDEFVVSGRQQLRGKNAGVVSHQVVLEARLQVGDDHAGSNDTSLGWIVNRAADGARRGVLCKYNSEEKRKGAQQNEVGSQAHDAVAREVLRNVSQGEWQMQL